jgi:hypothetical protein
VALTLTAWCALSLLALPFSRWGWSYVGGIQRYDIMWIGNAMLVWSSLLILAMQRMKRTIQYERWLWVVIPFLASVALLFEANEAFRSFVRDPSKKLAMAYAVYSCAYVAAILFWVVVFPFEAIREPHSERHGFLWKTAMGVVAIAIAVVTFRHSIGILRNLAAPLPRGGLLGIQVWMQTSCVASYMFMTTRVLVSGRASLVALSSKARETASQL